MAYGLLVFTLALIPPLNLNQNISFIITLLHFSCLCQSNFKVLETSLIILARQQNSQIIIWEEVISVNF